MMTALRRSKKYLANILEINVHVNEPDNRIFPYFEIIPHIEKYLISSDYFWKIFPLLQTNFNRKLHNSAS